MKPKKMPVSFYANASGTEPVREWLKTLSDQDRRIVGKDIQKVEFGWPIGMPYCRSLGNGLWEVRSDVTDSKIARVIFCIVKRQMVLLHGFIKKTRETPKKEIDLALKRKKEI